MLLGHKGLLPQGGCQENQLSQGWEMQVRCSSWVNKRVCLSTGQKGIRRQILLEAGSRKSKPGEMTGGGKKPELLSAATRYSGLEGWDKRSSRSQRLKPGTIKPGNREVRGQMYRILFESKPCFYCSVFTSFLSQ